MEARNMRHWFLAFTFCFSWLRSSFMSSMASVSSALPFSKCQHHGLVRSASCKVDRAGQNVPGCFCRDHWPPTQVFRVCFYRFHSKSLSGKLLPKPSVRHVKRRGRSLRTMPHFCTEKLFKTVWRAVRMWVYANPYRCPNNSKSEWRTHSHG